MKPNNYLKIKDFEYKNEATEASVAGAISWLDSTTTKANISTEKPGGYYHSLGNYALFDNDGKNTHQQLNWACHYTLSAGRPEPRSCVAFWCEATKHDNWRRYIDWLTAESFVAEFVLAVRPTGFVVSAYIPASVMHAIAMMSRTPRQFTEEVFVRFNSLIDKGISGELAYQCCFNIAAGDGKSAFTPSVDHRAWQCPSIRGMKQFINGEFENVKPDRLYTSHTNNHCSTFISTSYCFVSELWRDPYKDDFIPALEAYRKANTSDAYRPPNPFAKNQPKLPRHGECSIDEVHNFVLPYCLDKGIFE